MDIVTTAKNVATVLGTASILAYISGYLALRARAHALGTDPAFKLVDEAYVFAGFRFLFITLVVLLISAPVLLLAQAAAAWLNAHLATTFRATVEWVLVGLLAVTTILTLKILGVSGALLQQPDGRAAPSAIHQAILGGQRGLGLALTFVIVILTALSILWLRARPINNPDPLTWVLGAVVTLQLFVLPIYHGALFADRKVRVLGERPDAITRASASMGILDHTGEHVTLLGQDAGGLRWLATIKLDDLNGIPVTEIVSLNDFLGRNRTPHLDATVATGGFLRTSSAGKASDASEASHGSTQMQSNDSNPGKGFFEALADYLQITFEAIGSLGDSPVHSGQVWAVDIDVQDRETRRERVGTLGDLSWPVLAPDGKTIFAMQRGRAVRLSSDGSSTEVIDPEPRWSKLLGVGLDGRVLGLVREGGEVRPAMLAPDGALTVSPPPDTPEDRARISKLMQEARSYAGGRTLFVERSTQGGRGFDVFLKDQSGVLNLSDCAADRCGQASLSHDFRRALFVKEPRF